jgi:hypothetical protein
VEGLGVTGWDDGRGFDHEDDCSIRCPSAMNDTLRNYEALSRLQIDRLVFKVDHEVAIQDKEEFIVVVMLVPVVFALHNAQPHDGFIHLAEGLVVPLVRAGPYQSRYIDDRESWKLDVEKRGVGMGLVVAHLGLHRSETGRLPNERRGVGVRLARHQISAPGWREPA